MKVGIIGSGEVGQTLAAGFLAEGHPVLLGTRQPNKETVVKWQQANPKAQTGLFSAAAQFGEVLVLAVAGSAAEEAVKLAGPGNFSGKVVIDATNPTSDQPPTAGVLHFYTSLEDSQLERLQRLVPAARFVKAFNSVGSAFMYKPAFPGGTPTMFICGNDPNAKDTVTNILTVFGWEVEDMGQAEAARAIEPLCILWCIPGFLRNQWSHAFKLLKAQG
ncbi:MAG TPA: NAD(P)-binding domain-containing protein [Puia sp.]|nr:NAD(P)-binding domain-containing protein [Puia sp.]